MKRILTLLMALVLTMGLAACGSSDEKTGASGKPSAAEGIVFKNEESVDLGTPEKTLDPKEVYSKLTYTPEMFFGDYSLRGGDAEMQKFGAETKYAKWTLGGEEVEISVLPFEYDAGPQTFTHSINHAQDHHWMRLYFMRKYNETSTALDDVICSYSVEGDKLILKPLDSFEIDEENNKISYAFSDVEWEYTFTFSGRTVTFSSGESTVTLTAGLDVYDTVDYFCTAGNGNYLSEGSARIADIDSISYRYDAEDGSSRVYFTLTDETTSDRSIARLEENGLFTFTLALDDSAETYQYVYFYCSNDGLILTDGEEVYYYNESYRGRTMGQLAEYLSEDQTDKLDKLSDHQLEAMLEKKENLMNDLAAAFNDAGLAVSVDQQSGELAMDSSILFGGDSAVLTAKGKEFLNEFVGAYTSIVFSEDYENFIAQTVIEGHAAPVAGSTYESGLPLSEERAKNVKDYCISSETGVDTAKLAAALDAIGYSNSKPILDAEGEVDAAASRRVSFRFVINLDQA